MPCDTSVENSNEFDCVLNEISILINRESASYIVIGGDLNTDISNVPLHKEKILNFMRREHIVYGLESIKSDVDFTFESKISGIGSIIDHFILSENMFDMISSHKAIHNGDNLSDHCCMGLDVPVSSFDEMCNSSVFNIDWENVEEENISDYKVVLDSNLSQINIPWDAIRCKDFNCKEYHRGIEIFSDNIVKALLEAGEKCLPVKNNINNKSIP